MQTFTFSIFHVLSSSCNSFDMSSFICSSISKIRQEYLKETLWINFGDLKRIFLWHKSVMLHVIIVRQHSHRINRPLLPNQIIIRLQSIISMARSTWNKAKQINAFTLVHLTRTVLCSPSTKSQHYFAQNSVPPFNVFKKKGFFLQFASNHNNQWY